MGTTISKTGTLAPNFQQALSTNTAAALQGHPASSTASVIQSDSAAVQNDVQTGNLTQLHSDTIKLINDTNAAVSSGALTQAQASGIQLPATILAESGVINSPSENVQSTEQGLAGLFQAYANTNGLKTDPSSFAASWAQFSNMLTASMPGLDSTRAQSILGGAQGIAQSTAASNFAAGSQGQGTGASSATTLQQTLSSNASALGPNSPSNPALGTIRRDTAAVERDARLGNVVQLQTDTQKLVNDTNAAVSSGAITRAQANGLQIPAASLLEAEYVNAPGADLQNAAQGIAMLFQKYASANNLSTSPSSFTASWNQFANTLTSSVPGLSSSSAQATLTHASQIARSTATGGTATSSGTTVAGSSQTQTMGGSSATTLQQTLSSNAGALGPSSPSSPILATIQNDTAAVERDAQVGNVVQLQTDTQKLVNDTNAAVSSGAITRAQANGLQIPAASLLEAEYVNAPGADLQNAAQGIAMLFQKYASANNLSTSPSSFTASWNQFANTLTSSVPGLSSASAQATLTHASQIAQSTATGGVATSSGASAPSSAAQQAAADYINDEVNGTPSTAAQFVGQFKQDYHDYCSQNNLDPTSFQSYQQFNADAQKALGASLGASSPASQLFQQWNTAQVFKTFIND